MEKLLIFLGMTLGSWAGWYIGESIGLITAVILSALIGMFGVFLGWKINKAYFE